MPGIATVVLTDKELTSVIELIECSATGCELEESDWQLHAKFVAWREKLSCPVKIDCLSGEGCSEGSCGV